MVELSAYYKCNICGNVVLVTNATPASIVCCGEEMNKLVEKTIKQEGKEKHVPVIEIQQEKVIVKVGTNPHPMEEKHYIQLIEVLEGNKILGHKQLSPGDEPKAIFFIENASKRKIYARELCNIHGLWKS